MTLCFVITETIFIDDPHAGHRSGSTSKMRLSIRDQLAREGEGIGSSASRNSGPCLVQGRGSGWCGRGTAPEDRGLSLRAGCADRADSHTQASSFDFLDDVDWERPAGQIPGEAPVELRELQAPSARTWRWKLAAYEPKVWIETTRPGIASWRSRIARTLGTIASRAARSRPPAGRRRGRPRQSSGRPCAAILPAARSVPRTPGRSARSAPRTAGRLRCARGGGVGEGQSSATRRGEVGRERVTSRWS